MPQDSLRELLARVHEHLSRSGSVDQESRQLLGTVMRDIERALQPPAAAGDAATQAPRLESLAVRFEVGHPGLAETLRELIDALVKAGI
jgi:Domain of unknown function (DUF4404)